MLIIVGHRDDQRFAGDVEDFCPICRSIQVCHVYETFKATHVYFITVSRESLGQFASRCTSCGAEFHAERSPFDGADIAGLEGRDFPRASGATERLNQEDRVTAGDLSPDFRAYLLREPFGALENWVRTTMKSGIWDTRSILGIGALCVSFVVCLGCVIVLFSSNTLPGNRPPLLPAWPLYPVILVSIIVGVKACLVVTGASRRFGRRIVIPLLVRSLQPLKPTVEEIQEVLDESRARKMVMGKIINAESLCEAIMQADEQDLKTPPDSGAISAPLHSQ